MSSATHTRLRIPRWPLYLAAALGGLWVGFLLWGGAAENAGRADGSDTGETGSAVVGEAGATAAATEVWTCSMHPQIRQPDPGRCPLCGMDLIPASAETGGSDSAAELTLSPRARKLAAVEVAPVERRFVSAEVRMAGRVTLDETRVAYITTWIPGRLERLFVDYTGIPVRQGDHMVAIYSPELLSAQEELIQAARRAAPRAQRDGGATPGSLPDMAARTLEAAREKLRLWGLTHEQIESIEERERASDRLTLYAPISGIVIHKDAVEGMYVETGTRIFTIADLSHVWVELEAYESDLVWLRYGQDVTFEVKAYPGETFAGRIAFIDPLLDPRSRTVRVRLNVPNPDGRLKPEMFVHAVAQSQVAAAGRVMAPDMAGRWICPMHPEEVAVEPGDCGQCGMPLVRAETLGLAPVDPAATEAPLIVPASAPLITGRRAVVYVQDPEAEGTYRGREIELGPRAGDHYIVRGGLREGESVVVNGGFKIDSAIQIQAGPSMMNPDTDATQPATLALSPPPETFTPADIPPPAKRGIDAWLTHYYAIQTALSRDDVAPAQTAARALRAELDAVPAEDLPPAARTLWGDQVATLRHALARLTDCTELEAAREAFLPLSETMIALAERFGTSEQQPVLRFHCPMAFGGRGADWLQDHAGTENPYYGSMMYRCGDQTATLVPAAPAPDDASNGAGANGRSE